MKANFNSPLPRDHSDDKKIKASGPLIWFGEDCEPPPGSSCKVKATITQTVTSTTVVGQGDWGTNYNNGAQTWTGTVETDTGHFVPGIAFARGILTVTAPHEDEGEVYDWSQWLTLT